jgi:L-seryl-tRNA(Ser) seleniumtransferase
LPTALLALDPPDAQAFCAALRAADPPVIARVRDSRVLFDPRTVIPEQDDLLIAILKRILS